MRTEATEERILESPLYYNRNITINGTQIFYRKWYDKGIRFINDLVKENGKFYKLEEMKHRTGISLNYLQYQEIIDSIKTYMSKINIKLERKIESPFRPSHIKIFMQQKSGAQAMYNILNRNDEQPTGKKHGTKNFTSQMRNGKKYTLALFVL